ncbi:uncharacterized protein LOC100277756 [Zea mays]|uniref:Uncharacterized protein n=1 Tax=Zea mays TaxID=4577 RepID=B6TZN0_MAIZE|nr:uncharacterized protein LOC100277756 [Zea mays]ACG42563.1 hypothetical protein [Zea mays]|eukprot:NP_001144716.1 uncharacterized protein LOC100277756 [Zea mays]
MKSRRWATEEEIFNPQLGRTQDLHWMRDFGGGCNWRSASLRCCESQAATAAGGRGRGRRVAAPGGWSEFGALNSRGVSNPPMPSMTMLGARYVWPFLIWLFK